MKIYATDYDGTVTYHGVTPELLAALDKWRKAGNLFGVVSGRPYDSIKRAVSGDGLPVDFLIANNGAVIADGEDNILEFHSFDHTALKTLISCLAEEKHGYFRADALRFYREWPSVPESDISDDKVVIGDTEYSENTEVTVDYPTYEETLAAAEKIEKATNGKAFPLMPGLTCIDWVPQGVNKAAAIRRIAEIMGVVPDKVYTTGDGYNDVAMLTAEDFEGYAVANAHEKIREIVGRTITDPLELITKSMNGEI